MSLQSLNCVMCDRECSNVGTSKEDPRIVNSFFYCLGARFLKLKKNRISHNLATYGNPEDWPELKVCRPCRRSLATLSQVFLSKEDEQTDRGGIFRHPNDFNNSSRNSANPCVPFDSSSEHLSSKNNAKDTESKEIVPAVVNPLVDAKKSKEEMDKGNQIDKNINGCCLSCKAVIRVENDVEIVEIISAERRSECFDCKPDMKFAVDTKPMYNCRHRKKFLVDMSVQVDEKPSQSTQTEGEELNGVGIKIGHSKEQAINQGFLPNISASCGRPVETFLHPGDQLHKHVGCGHDGNSCNSTRTGIPGMRHAPLPRPIAQHASNSFRRCEANPMYYHHHAAHAGGPGTVMPYSHSGITKHHQVAPLFHQGHHHPPVCTQQAPQSNTSHCYPDHRSQVEAHHGHPGSAYGVSEPLIPPTVHHPPVNCNSACNQSQNCSQSQSHQVDLYEEYSKWQPASAVPAGPNYTGRQHPVSAPTPYLPQDAYATKPHENNNVDLNRRQFSSLWGSSNQPTRTQQQSEESNLQQSSLDLLNQLVAQSPVGGESNTLQLHSAQSNFMGILKSPEMQSNLITRPCAPVPLQETSNIAESLKTPAIPQGNDLPVDSLP